MTDEDRKFIDTVRAGDIRMVDALLRLGANVNAGGGAALRSATHWGNELMTAVLLAHGADARDGTAISWAADTGSVSLVRQLLRRGANPNANRGHPIKSASYRGNLPLIRLLVEHGADASVLPELQLRKLKLAQSEGTDTAQTHP